MHALVTGAGGFLGLYIVEQLVARGDRVRAFCRRRHPTLDELGVDTVVGDIRDADVVDAACEGIDIVFHAAGVAGIWGPWDHYYGINTLGTIIVTTACRKKHVPRLVYTSSPSVTFDGGEQLGIDESAPYPGRWLCHYQHSKALAEQFVLRANDDETLRTCALRPHLIWGPRDRHLIPRLLDRAQKGRLRRIGDGQNLIDMIYVENAAEAHLLAADSLSQETKASGKAYFISQGEPVNCWTWIDELLALGGIEPVNKEISFSAAWRLGRACEFVYGCLRMKREPPMTRFLAAQLAKSHYFNIDASREDFGYSPRVSTEEGMKHLRTELAASPIRAN